MLQVTVVGLNIEKIDHWGVEINSPPEEKWKSHPAFRVRQLLEKEGFEFHSEAELPLEKADIVFCVDLDYELYLKVNALPRKIHKILLTRETVLQSPLVLRKGSDESCLGCSHDMESCLLSGLCDPL